MIGLLRLVALLSLAACASGGTPREQLAVRVLTFNIHAGADAAGKPNLERVASLIDSLRADVVLLQEVDRGTQRSGQVDQLGELQRMTRMNGVFGKSLDYQGGDYGIAILSRFPITRDTTVELAVQPPQERSGGLHEPRVALHATIETPAGALEVVNTHLDPGRTATYRKQEFVGLMAHVRRAVPPNARLIVGGDLNTRPDTDEIAALGLALADAFAGCGEGSGTTFPASAPDRRIDYLFIRAVACRAAHVVAAEASDHRPLFLLLGIP